MKMVFDVDHLRDELSRKYRVKFISPEWARQWEANTPNRIVYEPKDNDHYKEEGWLFYAMHEIGHIKNGHKTQSQDIYERLRNEAEAWRWTRNELRTVGIEVPNNYIHECFGTYVDGFGSVLREMRDRFGNDVWWVYNRKAMNGDLGEIVYSGP